MKLLACGVALAIGGLSASPATADDSNVIDPLITAIFRSLAQQQGYNVLAAPDRGVADIGNIYYVTEPGCASDLTSMARSGSPINVFLAWEPADSDLPKVAARTEWKSVRLASLLGKAATAELKASLPAEKQAELNTALSALDQTNAQIFFGVRQAPSLRIKRLMETQLASQHITNAADLGNDATGAISPHAELVVQKFEFDRNAVQHREAGALLRFMDTLGLHLNAKNDVSTSYGYHLPTYSTLAFKPVTTLFKCRDRLKQSK